jgi:hypothetical protein
VAGLQLVPTGHSSVNDVCRLVAIGNIPAVPCAFDTSTAHADYEYVNLGQVERSCRVAMAATIDYLNSSAEEIPR